MDVPERLRVAVLAGGWSEERAVSLKSGEAVYQSLDRNKYDISWYDPREDLDVLMKKRGGIDMAFVLLHGQLGEDGRMQGMLDTLGIAFVGSGVLSSAMAFNKRVAKALYRSEGMTVPRDVILRRGDDEHMDREAESLGLPVVVKPVSEGSSVGICIADSAAGLRNGVAQAFQFCSEVLVEEYVKGREVTCCVLGNRELKTLPIIEIRPEAAYAFFDYEAKYTPGATEEICPAPISETLAERVRENAKRAHRALGCEVWSRTDMIIRDDAVILLETNTIPGMTQTSLFPLSARSAGMSFSQLLDELITLSLEKRSGN